MYFRNLLILALLVMTAGLSVNCGGDGDRIKNPEAEVIDPTGQEAVPEDVDQTDTDDDGIVDLFDNCPDDANEYQLDNDDDGFGNVCDDTPDGEEE